MKRLLEYLISGGGRLDKRVMLFTVRHENLMVAIAIAGLAVWGGMTGHPAFIFGLALVGATAYFAGVIIAVCMAFLLMGLDLFLGHISFESSSVVILQLIGYCSVAHLGYKHKTLRAEQRTLKKGHQVPWAVINEVRTSLSAIRFLLFPLQGDDTSNEELKKATSELSRLEKIFQDIERENHEHPRT